MVAVVVALSFSRSKSGGLALVVGLLSYERLDDFDDLLLLAAWETGHGFEKLACTSTRTSDAGGLGLAQQLLDGYAQGFGHGSQDIGTRNLPGGLPIPNVGMILANLAGKLTHRETGCLSEKPQTGLGRHEQMIGVGAK